MSTIIGLVSTFRLPLQNHDRLDFEVARDTSEVQKEQERATEWTSKQQKCKQRSKAVDKSPQIGHRSHGRHGKIQPPKKNHHITHQIIPTSRSPQHNHIFSIIPQQYQLHMQRIRQEI